MILGKFLANVHSEIKAMSKFFGWLQRVSLVLAIALVIIGLDQWSKAWVRATIPDYTYIVPIERLGEYFVFEHVHNFGAAFGILQNQGNLFIVIAVVVASAILYYAGTLKPDQKMLRVLLGLQLGGALGNVFDRFYQGFVTDFVRVGIPGVYYWPNFNVADSAIVCGVIGLAIYILFEDFRGQRSRASAIEAAAQSSDQHAAPSQDL
jgi:signal peptidase II